MKIGRIVKLEDALSYAPVAGGVEYTDVSGARVFVPLKLLVRLYEGFKHQHEQACFQSWDEYCKSLFSVDESK